MRGLILYLILLEVCLSRLIASSVEDDAGEELLFGKYPFQPHSNKDAGVNTGRQHHIEIRQAAEESGSGSDSCTYTSTVEPFSSIADTLDALALDCTSNPADTEFQYTVIYTGSSNGSFSTFSDDDILFVDYFQLGNMYTLTITTSCDICDAFDMTTEVSVSNYSNRLLPYGELLQDETLTGVDDDYTSVHVDAANSLPVYDKKYRTIYISSNGLISFTKPYINWQAVPFPYGKVQVPVLAPYWTDLDLRPTLSSLFNKVYSSNEGNRAKTLLDICSDRITEYSNENFSGKWMLVSTWSNAVPYLGVDHEDETITFQVALITNFSSTYALFLYETGFNIDELTSSIVIGHTAADFINYHNVEFESSETYLNIDSETGNTGKTGQWLFDLSHTLSSDEEIERRCIEWANEQENPDIWTAGLPSCPCSRQQANCDWRYSFHHGSRSNCSLFIASSEQSTVECCYDHDGALLTDTTMGGSYVLYSSLFYSSEYEENDRIPYANCCEGSNNCELFHTYRPVDNCSRYTAPIPGFMWGDPHFDTVDGKRFTFNGLGEFTLLNSPSNNLNIQARLQKYETTSATVLTAIAIKHRNCTIIQLEMNKEFGTYVLYLDDDERSSILPEVGELIVITDSDVYFGDSLSSVDPSNFNNVYMLNDNDTFVIVSQSDAILRISKEFTFFYIVLELGEGFINNTEGLLGNFDRDSSNDFLLPNGTILSNNLNEEQVYYQFGLKWHITEDISLFNYHENTQYSNYNEEALTFTPSFGLALLEGNSELNTSAKAACGDDYSCLYDTGQSGSLILGMATHTIRETNRDIKNDLDNLPPNITGLFKLVVTAGTLYTSRYEATDPDTGTETDITIKEPVPDGIDLNATDHLLVSLSVLPSIPLYLTSTDSNNTVTTRRVSILLCDCKNGGTCIEDPTSLPLDTNGHYRLLCNCVTGFGGDYCEINLSGCGQAVCPSYTVCEEDENVDVGYQCVECGSGYELSSEDKCVDINECTSGSDLCSQVCINSDGGYKCSCNDGYKLQDDEVTCVDIDECAELTDNCAQFCTNTDGGYTCSCVDYWESSDDGITCTVQTQCSEGGIKSCLENFKGECYQVSDSAAKCVCLDGKYFDSFSCLDCANNTFGIECNRSCDCQNGGTCNASTGCTCTPEYTGYDCTTEINTYSPEFVDDNRTNWEIPEAITANTSLLLISATDNDMGKAGEVTYHLVSSPYELPTNISNGSGAFNINETSGLLTTIVNLDSQQYKEFLLHIKASDGAAGSKSAVHLLYINLTTESLPYPAFTLTSYEDIINENKPTGSTVLTEVSCYEVKSINSALTDLRLEILSGNTNSTFKIESDEILTAKEIDYEKFQIYHLQISCTNGFNNTAIANMTVIVANLDDNPFIFSEDSYYIELYENVTMGTLVVTLQASDADHPDFEVGYFFADGNNFADTFSLNMSTGVLRTTDSFDREKRDNYTLQIVAQLYEGDGTLLHNTTTAINLVILDVNDFTPLFNKSVYISTNLSQSNEAMDTVLFLSAKDNDLGMNGEFLFSIESNTNFNVDSETGKVFVNTMFLDRGSYQLQVYAIDLGAPQLTGSSQLNIYVKPTPNQIYFNNHKYTFSTSEGSPLGFLIGTVEAVLYDVVNASINEDLEYSFIDEGFDTLPFFLDSESGEIIILSPLDYDTETSYTFKLSANIPDIASIPSATTRVQVNLVDENDNDPIFVPSSYSKVIYEDEPVNRIILTVSATDKDKDSTQKITYSLEKYFMGPFDINSTSGDIYISDDLGLPQDYHFVVIATDSGEPSLSSEAIVYISVARRSVVGALLNSTLYVFNISESVTISGIVLGTVGALINGDNTVTEDHGLGFRLKEPGYESDLSALFAIDSASGDVTSLSHSFNYEVQEEYVFYVELYDTENVSIVHDSAPIVIKLLDSNDNAPVFMEEFYSGFVSESTEAGTSILTVSASDPDSYVNSEVLYSLTSPVLGFHVDPYTGEVTVVNSSLISGDYHITVTATDKGDPEMSSSVDLYVSVIPGNTNITFSEVNYSFAIPENSNMDTLIGSITVTEITGETVDYNTLTFEITPSTECISIEQRDLKVGCATLDKEKQTAYAIAVKVSHVTAKLTGIVGVYINITDTNDNPPVFDRGVYTVAISTNYNNSIPILQPLVVDPDIGSNAVTHFQIESSDPIISSIFQINSETGAVFLSSLSSPGDYSFILKAIDTGNHLLNNSALVQVTIFEPGPKVLEFSESSLNFSVPENSPGGTFIGTVELLIPILIDPADYIGNLHFEIIGGGEADYFHIFDENASLVLVNNFLDRENSDSHVILAKATFQDYNVSANAYVTIEVSDVNDNEPQFTKSVYSQTISTSSELGASVVTVHADDDDEGTNADITYSFSNKSESRFSIESTTGEITTAVAPLQDDHYKLIVTAIDGGYLQFSSTCVVSVFVEVPVPDSISFTSTNYIFTISENNSPGARLGIVSISEDTEILDDLVYSFMTPSDSELAENLENFHLDALSGNITVLVSLDREEFSGNDFTVVAEVPSEPTLSASAIVTIIINDENDNTPIFDQAVYADGSITEGSINKATTILTVHALDNDNGDNGTIEYAIMSGGSNFTIGSISGAIKASNTDLVSGTYHLSVTAMDAGSPSLTGSAVVLITVYAPIPNGIAFKKNSYIFTKSEYTTPGTLLGTLELKTIDLSYVTSIQYTASDDRFILVGNELESNMLSSIQFDYEEETTYTFTVTAIAQFTDANIESVTASTSITVTITDENDNAPTFNNLPGDGIYDESVAEGTGNNNNIIQLSTSDLDSGENDDIDFSLLDNFDNRFKITSSGMIRTGSTVIDRETHSSFLLTVVATDNGTPPLSTTALVHVTVTDVNDNTPKLITGTVYNIHEEQKPNVVLFTIIAEDPDEGGNGEVSYDLSGGPFEVHPTSGEVFSTEQLDSDDGPSDYTITLELRDGGVPVNEDTETIVIHLLDVPNDNRPYFKDTPYSAQISPYAKAGENVTKVVAGDADGDTLSFELVPTENSNKFSIDGSGQVKKISTDNLDRGDDINLIVKVTDDSIYELSATTQIVVEVLRDLEFSQETYIFEVPEDAETGTTIGQLMISDVSLTLSSTFVINDDSVKEMFALGPNETHVSVLLLKDLDYDNDNGQAYTFFVTVSRVGYASQITHVTINVGDINDNAPIFTDPENRRKFSIYESDSVGTVVGVVNASDADSGSNGDINFSLQDPSLPFEIDSKTGRIRTTEGVSGNEIDIVIQAVDSGTQPITGTATYTVSVTSRTTTTTGGGSSLGSIAGVAVVSVFLIIAVIVIVVLIVLLVTKRRERVKNKDRDPYQDGPNEDWVLKGTKREKRNKKKGKGDQEMKRKGSLIDSSAYETMYEDDILGNENMPWMNPNYLADTEDNQSSSLSRPPSMESKGHFSRNNIPFKGNRVPSVESTDSDMNSSLKPGLIPIRPGILPSKPGVTPGLGITPSRPQISKPGVTPGLGITPSRPLISKPGVTPGLGITPSRPQISKPGITSGITSGIGITPSRPQISKPGVTSGIAPSRPQIMKPGVTPTRPSITPLKPGTGGLSQPPISRPSLRDQQDLSRRGSQPDRLSQELGPRRNKRSSPIDSGASDLDTEDYLKQYQHSTPMKPGERPSEFDLFLKPNDSKPPAGTRPSLKDVIWPHGPPSATNRVDLKQP